MKRDRRVIDCEPERFDQLDGGQLPEPTEQSTRRASREQDLAGVLEPDEGALEQREIRRLLARGDHRQLVLPAGSRGLAEALDRADQTARLGRCTDRGAELHEALVEIAGRGGRWQGRHERAGLGPQRLGAGRRFDVVLDRRDAAEHARDVAVDQRRALAERDRRDRAGGIRSDAGHRAQLGGSIGQRAAEPIAHRLGAGVQVARARVVAEAGPRREHGVERRAGERDHRRELLHPALPVRDHGRDPGLLQHDLAHPDRVGIAGPAPRQVALDLGVVLDDRRRDRSMAGHAPSYHGPGAPRAYQRASSLAGVLGHAGAATPLMRVPPFTIIGSTAIMPCGNGKVGADSASSLATCACTRGYSSARSPAVGRIGSPR